MNKLTYILAGLTVILAVLVLRAPTTQAETNGASFAGVIPFINSTGYLGLFNQNTGKIYMYNSDLTKCVYEGKIEQLGKPFIKTEQPAAAAANGY